ncbi:MAG: hypothetical protein ACRDZX_00385 [Acidimicrobiales bacterium]
MVNTFAGPPLVPAGPTAGIICRYRPLALPTRPGTLARQTLLDEVQARHLAGRVRRLDLRAPVVVFHCPADFGAVALIGLSYPGREDVGLWYHASGCQSVDNGAIGSSEGGNPSFYMGFETAVDRLSPPLGDR